MSLRLRLVLIFAAGSLATLVVALGYLHLGFRREIDTRNRNLLATEMQDVASIILNHQGDQAALEDEVLGEGSASPEAPIFMRVLEGARIRVEAPGMGTLLPSVRYAGAPRLRIGRRHFLVAERTVGAWTIQGALEVTGDDRMLQAYRRNLLVTLLLGVALSSLSGLWAVHLGLRPLRAITDAARGITAQDLQRRLHPGNAPPELRDLVESLNGMLDRLDHAFSRLSRFSADLAHELRTPITVLMGEAEVALSQERTPGAYRAVLESSLEEFRRLSRLVSRMLFLARAEDPGARVDFASIDAAGLLGEVLAFYEAVAEERGITLTADGSGALRGDAVMLRQALANLVSNALEATPRGGRVQLGARAGSHGSVLEVRDSGRGIPPEDLPHLFDRFYRTSEAFALRSPGTGLGLAIVQAIAHLHGGGLRVASEPGLGTTVTLDLPA